MRENQSRISPGFADRIGFKAQSKMKLWQFAGRLSFEKTLSRGVRPARLATYPGKNAGQWRYNTMCTSLLLIY
jgi:hypothetical protein